MKVVQYRALWGNGQAEFFTVTTRTINSGFGKALKLALRESPASWGDFHSLEFWMVLS